MKSLEEIAQKAAEGFRVSLEHDPSQNVVAVRAGDGVSRVVSSLELALALDAVDVSDTLRPHVRALIGSALREALAVPGEPPVDEERIEQTRRLNNDAGSAWSHKGATDRIAELLAQLDHYQRFAALITREPEGQCYAAGYDAGRAAAMRDVRAIVSARMAREQDDADADSESAWAAYVLRDLLAELGAEGGGR